MATQQSFMCEMFAGNDAEASYTDEGQYYVKFLAYWSRNDKEKIGFDCVVWGNKTASDNPSAKELGPLAVFAANVKKGDKLLVRGRIKGTADGKPRTWTDKEGNLHVAFLELVVFELSITQSKADRPAKPTAASMPEVDIETGSDNSVTTPVTAPQQTAIAVQPGSVFDHYVSKQYSK